MQRRRWSGVIAGAWSLAVAGVAFAYASAAADGPAAPAPVYHRVVVTRPAVPSPATRDTLSLEAELARTRAQLERISERLDALRSSPRTRGSAPARAHVVPVPPALLDDSGGTFDLGFLAEFAESIATSLRRASPIAPGGLARLDDAPVHVPNCWSPAFDAATDDREYVARRSHTIAVPGGAPIRITHSYGDVSVEPSDGEEIELVERVSVDWQGRDPDAVARYLDALTVSAVRRGDSVLVSLTRPAVRPPDISQLGLDLALRVPAGHPIVVGSSYGDVVLRGLTSPLTARSSFGDVEVVRTSGPLVLGCQNGDVVVRRHDGSLVIDNANGAVNLVDVSGAVSVSGRLSEVFGRMLDGACTLDLRGGSGLVSDIQGSLTVSGEKATLEARDIEGRVTLTSDLGDVRLTRLQSGASVHVRRGSLEVEEGDGDIDIEARDAFTRVQSPSGRLHLNSQRGDVVVDARDGAPLHGLRADVIDGSAVIYVSPTIPASVEARAVGGHILTDLPLAVVSGPDGTRTSGFVGGGTVPLTINTTSGSVYLYAGISSAQAHATRIPRFAPRPDAPRAVPAVRPER